LTARFRSTRARAYQSASGNRGAPDRVVVYDHDTEGQVIREKHYGADRQAIEVGDLGTIGLPAKAGFRAEHGYQYGVRKSTSIQDDCQTGRPCSRRST
jgi:hypothetical protein